MRFLKIDTVSFLIFVCFISLSFAHADQVVLKNGDRVTGVIIKKDAADLTVETGQMGKLVIPWNQIESVIAEAPLYVTLNDGTTLHGTFIYSGAEYAVTAAGDKKIIAAEKVAAIRNDAEEAAFQRLQNPGWFELWSGTGTLGFAGTAGNSKTLSFTTGFNAGRTTRIDRTSIYFSAIKAGAQVDGVTKNTAEAVRGGIGYSYNAMPRVFINAFNDYEYDRFQNLDLRFVIGGGIGYNLIRSDRARLDLLTGGAFNHSRFSTPLTRNSAELYWGNDYSLKLTSTASLVQSYRMFNNLTDTGTYRMNFDIGLNTQLWKWLSWNVSISNRFLSDPAPGRKKNDFLYTTGIGISFGK
ncbi:MAG TPA: DUF481 domain-containing protein [Acidobacteriota bacterium]|nr:DUF481 domain-containing protein [Acidobacteriota bacterium]